MNPHRGWSDQRRMPLRKCIQVFWYKFTNETWNRYVSGEDVLHGWNVLWVISCVMVQVNSRRYSFDMFSWLVSYSAWNLLSHNEHKWDAFPMFQDGRQRRAVLVWEENPPNGYPQFNQSLACTAGIHVDFASMDQWDSFWIVVLQPRSPLFDGDQLQPWFGQMMSGSGFFIIPWSFTEFPWFSIHYSSSAHHPLIDLFKYCILDLIKVVNAAKTWPKFEPSHRLDDSINHQGTSIGKRWKGNQGTCQGTRINHDQSNIRQDIKTSTNSNKFIQKSVQKNLGNRRSPLRYLSGIISICHDFEGCGELLEVVGQAGGWASLWSHCPAASPRESFADSSREGLALPQQSGKPVNLHC